jgi:arginase
VPGPATVIGSPYDSGRRGWRMGRGPLELLEGREGVVWLDDVADGPEVWRTFALNARLAGLVAAAPGLPVVVAGNCNVAMAHAGRADGIVWLDAHGDLHTPKTTRSGFFDGMALSIAVGDGWEVLRATVPGFAAVDPRAVTLVGVRDLDAAEAARVEALGVGRAGPAEVAAPGERTYLHIDLDCLDSERIGPANAFAVPGGLLVEDVLEVIERLRPTLVGASLTAWDPSCDRDGAVRAAAHEILAALAG